MTQITATYIDHMGTDLSVVNAARVSFGKQSEWEESFEDCDKSLLKLSDRDTKLIKYLAKHKHISPFGHAFASFHVKAPIFVARQLVKHKFLRWNEISLRYVDDGFEFYVPAQWRGRSADKKQGSEGTVYYNYDKFMHENSGVNFGVDKVCLEEYKDMLKAGVAPEMARMVLPVSTMTEFYWSGSLDAFASMCVLRLKGDTQYETRLVAQQIDEVMSSLFPVSWKALVHDEA